MFPSYAVRTFLLLAALTSPVLAQEPAEKPARKFLPKPLWITWHSAFNENSAMNYFKSVTEQAGLYDGLDKRMREEIEKERPTDRPIKGTAMFMQQGLIPGVDTVDFRELKDEAEFQKIINERQRQFGGNKAKVTGSGNNRKVEFTQTWENPKYVQKTVKGPDGKDRQTYEQEMDKDGKPVMQTQSYTRTAHFRLEKGVLFEATFAELEDMDLPDLDTLGLGRRKRDEDLYFRADLKLVPKGLKTLFWNLVKGQANVMMQQRDSEGSVPYEFRKSVSEMTIEFMRTLVFDIEEATGSIKLATDTQPVRAAFNVKMRSNSSLAKQLRDLGKGRGRLPIDEDAVLALRSTWAMPKSFQQMLTTAAPYLRTLADEHIDNDDAVVGVTGIADSLERSAEEGTFDATIHMGGTAESGPVLYGAVRLREGEKTAEGLKALMEYAIKQSGPGPLAIDSVAGADRQYVQIKHSDAPQVKNGAATAVVWPGKLKPECAYLAGDKDSIWFAVGRETAWQILEQKMGNREMKRAKSTLANLSLDMSRFLDEDDPAGLHEFGKKLEVEYENIVMGAWAGSGDFKLPEAPELLHMLEDGGKVKVTLNSDKRGLFLRAELDEAFAAWWTARLISSQNRIQELSRKAQEAQIKEQQKMLQEQQMKLLEAKKAADGSDN